MGGTMTVHPGEITECATKIGQLTAISSKLNNDATSNSVPQLSWGALGNLLGLYQSYDDTLKQLHDHFTTMGDGFGKISQGLKGTAQDYHENEQVATDSFGKIMNQMISSAQPPAVKETAAPGANDKGLGSSYADQYSGENLGKNGAKMVPTGGSIFSTVKDGMKLGQDIKSGDGAGIAADSGALVSDMASYVASGADIASAVADPLNWLLSKGLDFLLEVVAPLKQCVDLVTGDPDATGKAADGFKKISDETGKLAQTYEDDLNKGLGSWTGDAANAAATKLVHFHSGIEETAGTAAHVASVLQASSMVMKIAEDILKGILTDLIEWLIITWVAALAASVVTLGASDAAAALATPIEASAESAKGASEVNKVRQIITKIIDFLKKVKQFLDIKITKGLGKLDETKLGKSALKKFKAPDALSKKLTDGIKDDVGIPGGESLSDKIKSGGKAVNTWTSRGAGVAKGVQDEQAARSDDDRKIDNDLDV